MAKREKFVEPDWFKDRQHSVRGELPRKIRQSIEHKTDRHQAYTKAIEIAGIVYCTGPAGTGKSFMACAKALELLLDENRPFAKIVVTKPNVGCGNESGYRPGTVCEKHLPLMASVEDNFQQVLSSIDAKHVYKELKDEGAIKFHPIEFMRGANLRDSIVIVDEAQNCTFGELTMILTRGVGETKFLVNGDLLQRDIRDSGLREMIRRTKKDPLIEWVRLMPEDNMRGGLNRRIAEYAARPFRSGVYRDVSFWSW